jgi:N-methylhydantoinase B
MGGARSSRWNWSHNGGTGARPTRDGLSATAFPSGVWGSQVETSEAVAPVLFHRRELRPDSGGAGTRRGGLGQRIEMSAATIRIGEDGPDLPPKGTLRVPEGETLIFETPGGGGYGPPEGRSDEDLTRDLATGLITDDSVYRRPG